MMKLVGRGGPKQLSKSPLSKLQVPNAGFAAWTNLKGTMAVSSAYRRKLLEDITE